jgi:hypothetical protein
MNTIRALTIMMLVLTGSASAQDAGGAAGRHPLVGAWSRVATVTNGNVVANQPGFRLFVDGYYSIVRVEGLAPRTPAPGQGATAAQVRAALQAFTGQGGSYQIASMQTVTQHPTIAYVPGNMAPGRYAFSTYHIVADTLVYTTILNQGGPVANPQVGKYVRVRSGGPTTLDGAWRQIDGRSADGTVTDNQPAMRLFVDGYYSLLRVNGTAPRPALPGPEGTAEQLMAVWGPFSGQAGSFEVSGQTLITRPLVAKGPAGMGPGIFSRISWRMSGDTLFLSQVETQTGPVANPLRYRYVRARPTVAAPTN